MTPIDQSRLEGSQTPIKVGLLWRYADQSPIYTDWSANHDPDLQFHVLKDYHLELPQDDWDVLVTHMHYRWDELTLLRDTLEKNRTAVLVLVDGILEFRNTWLNPNIPAGSMLQPAVAHRIATLGHGQSRLLNSWGNQGRCEIVGLPRLDSLLSQNGWWDSQQPSVINPIPESQPWKVLVASATTPAFDESQWEIVRQAYQELAEEIQIWNQNQSHPIEVTWRVSPRICEALNLPPADTGTPLAQVIQQSDAVVTSASTIQLEAMACRKPTVLLDYFPYPKYVPSAWQIGKRQDVATIFLSLVQGDQRRMNFQDETFKDQLWTSGSSSDRLRQLILSMGRAAQQARQNQSSLQLLDPILPLEPSAALPGDDASTFLGRTRTPLPEGLNLAQWIQQNEVQAAIHRATSASSDRSDLVRLDREIRRQKDNYESIINEKQEIIDEMAVQLEKKAKLHDEIAGLLEQRNRDFEQLQKRIGELSEARIADHQLIAEAHADAKAKQQRVNELRQRCESLVQRLQNQGGTAANTPAGSSAADPNYQQLKQQYDELQSARQRLSENYQKLSDSHEQLARRIEELVAERKSLYERLKQSNQG